MYITHFAKFIDRTLLTLSLLFFLFFLFIYSSLSFSFQFQVKKKKIKYPSTGKISGSKMTKTIHHV